MLTHSRVSAASDAAPRGARARRCPGGGRRGGAVVVGGGATRDAKRGATDDDMVGDGCLSLSGRSFESRAEVGRRASDDAALGDAARAFSTRD